MLAKIASSGIRNGRIVLTLLLVMFTSIGTWAEITGEGTEDNPYVIHSEEDWNTLADLSGSWRTWPESQYDGKVFRLDADITVSRMVGNYIFRGTFNGNGHTLTFNFNAHNEYAAPFKGLDDVTIKNLKVDGVINTDTVMACGLAVFIRGNSYIENCISSITINGTRSDYCYHSGFIGSVDGGYTTMINCVFNGSINNEGATYCAGFKTRGWGSGTGYLLLRNCLMTGRIPSGRNNSSFVSDFVQRSTLENCYYVGSYTLNQGTEGYSLSLSSLAAALGDKWVVSDDQVLPIINPNDLRLAVVSGINDGYQFTGSPIDIAYSMKDANGNDLVYDTDYTATFHGAAVSDHFAISSTGVDTLVVTAKAGSAYTGTYRKFLYVTENIPYTPGLATLENGTYDVMGRQTTWDNIKVIGEVTLNLCEGGILNAQKGICVTDSNTLNIEGTGVLNATGYSTEESPCTRYAAIGAVTNYDAGTINIKGGTINAVNDYYEYGATIGGAYNHFSGRINISGGVVNARNQGGGAAIGGSSFSTGGIINISGGIVNAVNAKNSASAIGCGGGNWETWAEIDSITITGGTITATQPLATSGPASSTAIGGGYYSSGGVITILGGKITTNSSAGIGAGYSYKDKSSKIITIGLSRPDDYLDISTYECGKVVIAKSSLPLKQEADGGNIYAADAEITDLSLVNGQKMVPYIGSMHAITFNTNGGSSVPVQRVLEGATGTCPVNPVKPGYNFAGWMLNDTPYDFTEEITQNITLMATWTALSPVEYVDSTGSVVSTTDYVILNPDMTRLNGTDAHLWLVDSDMTIDHRVMITDSVSFILADGVTLTVPKGFSVNSGNSLTFYGQESNTGTLYAGTTTYYDQITEERYAAIGGEPFNDGGTFTFYGGTIYAVGGETGAGIGGGYNGHGGVINIHGGFVNAKGGNCAASIGGGIEGNGGMITISGGSVNANSGSRSSFGAAIGGGRLAGAGTIVISGGNVYATSTTAAAIGTGQTSQDGDPGSITISGGTVVASSAHVGNAGIGSGIHSKCPDITITGGTVNTRYSCIGEDATRNYALQSEGASIVITGGIIKADVIGITGDYQPTKDNMTISISWTNENDTIQMGKISANLLTAAPKPYMIASTNSLNLLEKKNIPATVEMLSYINTRTVLVPATTFALSANEAHEKFWTTFYCSGQGYKINADENANAYTATVSNSVVTLHKLGKVIPANTPVIIVGEDNSIDMTYSSDEAEYAVENDLRGLDVANETSALGEGVIFVLGNVNSHFGFHKFTGTTMADRKAFLLVDNTNARELTVAFEGETTGIDEMTTSHVQKENTYYDLQGRKVVHPQKGLYIANGKKVIF